MTQHPERLRLFIALDLPPAVKALLTDVQNRMQREIGAGVRWTAPTGIHLTLKFLGETDQSAAIKAELDRIGPQVAPFALATAHVGVFPSLRQPRVVWLGIGGDGVMLQRLHQQVEQHIAPLGFPSEARRFSPHLTLGRIGTPLGADALATLRRFVEGGVALPTPKQWTAHELVLMRSELERSGARYTAFHTIAFQAAGNLV